MHGAAAPQVKEKAAERLREGVMPMLATLYRLANDDTVPPAVQLAAVRDWLDRSGIKEHIVVEVEVKPWERLVDGVIAEVADDALRPASALLLPAPALSAVLDDAWLPTGNDGLVLDEPRIPSRRKRQRGQWS